MKRFNLQQLRPILMLGNGNFLKHKILTRLFVNKIANNFAMNTQKVTKQLQLKKKKEHS